MSIMNSLRKGGARREIYVEMYYRRAMLNINVMNIRTYVTSVYYICTKLIEQEEQSVTCNDNALTTRGAI